MPDSPRRPGRHASAVAVAPEDEERQQVLDAYRDYINPAMLRQLRALGLDIVETRTEGCYVWDSKGNRYLDCWAGPGVFALGHRPPAVVNALIEALGRTDLGTNMTLHREKAELSRLLAVLSPGDLTYSFLCNSGTEAVEAALKIARLSTGKREIICTTNAYHGKTMGALSATGRESFRAPFAPLVEGFTRVPYGDAGAAEVAMGEHTAAMIVEPIQGEGGVVIPPEGYLRALREACDAHGVLLIFDEVQTGLGRTGKLFACEHEGVAPDIMTLAKALGGGVFPIGAMLATPEVWDCMLPHPYIHTSTFGGNTLACVCAIAALTELTQRDLATNAARVGARLLAGLAALRERYPDMLLDVRGRGLLIGMQFAADDVSLRTSLHLVKEGVIAAFGLNNPSVMRLAPPLILTEEQADTVVAAFDAALARER